MCASPQTSLKAGNSNYFSWLLTEANPVYMKKISFAGHILHLYSRDAKQLEVTDFICIVVMLSKVKNKHKN